MNELALFAGAGIDGERSGMWRHMARIIREVRPRFVFVENSPMLVSRGLGTVLGDLASMGFDARWGVLGAADVGANHQRDRIWIVGTNLANSPQLFSNGGNNNARVSVERKTQSEFGDDCWTQNVGDAEITGFASCPDRQKQRESWGTSIGSAQWWKTEPDVGRVADGVAARVDRLKAIGNGQVPLCAATAWQILTT